MFIKTFSFLRIGEKIWQMCDSVKCLTQEMNYAGTLTILVLIYNHHAEDIDEYF